MPYEIVTINVSQTISAEPNNLQQRAAVLSFGSLMQTAGVPSLLVDKSEINDRIRNPIQNLVATYTPNDSGTGTEGGESGFGGDGEASTGQAGASGEGATKTKRQLAAETRAAKATPLADGTTSFVLTAGDGRTFNNTIGSTVVIEISGCVPTTFNGTWTATVQSANVLTWSSTDVQVNGSPTQLGYFTLDGSQNVQAGLDSYFAQGSAVGVYLLDLGTPDDNSVAAQVGAFSDYLNDPRLAMYGYLVPATWDGSTNFVQLANNWTANDAKVYFYITTAEPVNSSYESPYDGLKSVVAIVDPTSIASAADDTTSSDMIYTNAAAAFMYLVASADPSPVNKVAPFSFRYMFGLTAVDYRDSLTAALRDQHVNYIQTGAEGGISNNILAMGVTSDGRDFAYWYSVDWIQINVRLQLANAVINGSNNPINPLYYDQDGIDRLQQRAQSVFNTGTAIGLVNGTATVNAIGFRDYVKLNPGDYATGNYNGLSAEYTPQRGFLRIVFNVNVNLNPQQQG